APWAAPFGAGTACVVKACNIWRDRSAGSRSDRVGQRKPCPPGGARSIVRGAAVRRRLRTFEHSIVPHDRGNAQPIVLEYAATALRLDGAMNLQIAPRVHSSSSRQNDSTSSLPESDTLRKRSIE